jgi:hypothetical protein
MYGKRQKGDCWTSSKQVCFNRISGLPSTFLDSFVDPVLIVLGLNMGSRFTHFSAS